MTLETYVKISKQKISAFANLPRIPHPDGGRKIVDNPDLWFASKINSTLKKQDASEIYWEKSDLSQERQNKFVIGLRNHSLNRQHMGAFVVSSIDFETTTSSLVSSAFAQGKFYKMQQQTRRSVILDSIISTPLDERDDVKSSIQDRFEFYWKLIEQRPDKALGFDPYIQDSFKLLPLSTETRFTGTLDLRTAKGYTRWHELDYLPSSVKNFAKLLETSILQEFPIMFRSHILDKNNESQLHLEMVDKVGSQDLLFEPLLWYADHTFLIPENKVFDKIYNDLRLKDQFNTTEPDSIFLGYFNPLGLSLDELLELFKRKDEATKAATEIACFAFISKVDISGGIDTWRHTRVNRIIQPIYHALDNGANLVMPVLYQRQQKSSSKIPDQFMEKSKTAVKIYFDLVKEGVPKNEAINILPHTLELYQIEMMDIFSFLNIMAIRTCIHSRPEVQMWSKSMLREVSKTPDFSGLNKVVKDGILARGLQLGYCAELGTCKKCGQDVVYLPDPLR